MLAFLHLTDDAELKHSTKTAKQFYCIFVCLGFFSPYILLLNYSNHDHGYNGLTRMIWFDEGQHMRLASIAVYYNAHDN